jgi:hypothetical protein
MGGCCSEGNTFARGVQQTTVIDSESIPMWLATIDENRVSPEAKPKLIAYQREARVALDAYFNKRRSPAPAMNELDVLRAAIDQIQAAQREASEAKDIATKTEAGTPPRSNSNCRSSTNGLGDHRHRPPHAQEPGSRGARGLLDEDGRGPGQLEASPDRGLHRRRLLRGTPASGLWGPPDGRPPPRLVLLLQRRCYPGEGCIRCRNPQG